MTAAKPILLAEDNPRDAELALAAMEEEHISDKVVLCHDGAEVLDYLYCRGSSDDKAQALSHFFALESILKSEGKLPVNVKIFIESEEEGGSGSTPRFDEAHRDLLACDAVLISDTSWPSPKVPTIIYALRGITYFQVKVVGSTHDLHSGMYGGKVPNALNAMAQIIASFHDKNGKIAIEGVYDDVLPLSAEEKQSFAKVAESDEDLKKEIGVTELFGEKGFTSSERNWARPALDVNGIWGGYSGTGSKTVIAAEGSFKASIRLVANQKREKIDTCIKAHIRKFTPPGVKAEIEFLHGAGAVMVATSHPLIACAQDSIEEAFGARALLVREGASIPIAETFISALNAPPIMMGFGLHNDLIHSPNERSRVDHFYKGIESCIHFYQKAASVKLAP